jgi:hypothetical protein
MGRKVTDYLLYRWRYILGYGVIALIIISLLIVAALFVPGALSQDEMQSVVTSSQPIKSLDPSLIVNLPYHLLQRASLSLFGVSVLSIKLPSLILSALSIVGMFLLLRGWFRHNVAVLTTLLIITTGQFLFISQHGTPEIVYIFWSVWLLVAALMISRKARFGWLWKIILAAIVSLSLYTPLSVYIIAALLSAIILHPHLRYLVRRLPKLKTALALFVGLIMLTPLAYTIWQHPDTGLTLLGAPQGSINIQANALQFVKNYLDFLSPTHGVYMAPLYGIGTLALIALGIMRLFTATYTARSYIITAWVLLLIPVTIINPNSISITFVPALLLMAMGVASLISMWYDLFPRNPYARIVGLVPLVILMGGMLFTSVDRYINGYSYNPTLVRQFSQDIRLLNRRLAMNANAPVTLVVDTKEQPFYSVVAKYDKRLTVVTQTPSGQLPSTLIVSRTAQKPAGDIVPTRIVTSPLHEESDRFYIYKTDQK